MQDFGKIIQQPTTSLFITNSLIDIVRSNKNKLHCCFVDFKQAFDTVWRPGLWQKLSENNTHGKCFKVILKKSLCLY